MSSMSVGALLMLVLLVPVAWAYRQAKRRTLATPLKLLSYMAVVVLAIVLSALAKVVTGGGVLTTVLFLGGPIAMHYWILRWLQAEKLIPAKRIPFDTSG